jgi:hypothetical protein
MHSDLHPQILTNEIDRRDPALQSWVGDGAGGAEEGEGCVWGRDLVVGIGFLFFCFCFDLLNINKCSPNTTSSSAFHIEVLDCLRGISLLGGIGWYNPCLPFC